MSMKPNIIYSLNRAQGLLDSIVANLNSRSDWLYQAHPKANHPLWIVGHLGLADNMFLGRLDAESGVKPEGWDELFWFGSEIQTESDKYPESDEVLAYNRDRRTKLLAAVEELSDEFLLSPTPDEGMFADAPNMAQMLFFISFHAAMHIGQLTVAHRGLGHEPVVKPG